MNLMSNNMQTMTSREMADLTEKRHDNVRRTIESLFSEGLISKPQIEDGIKAANGVVERVYHVGKRDSYVVVAQLSPEFTARLVDRWQELEAAAPKALDLSDPETLRTALLTYAERVITLTAKVEAQAPAVAFVEQYADATGLKGFREVAKLLKVKENAFADFLVDREIMYRLAGRLTPYAPHLDAGRFKVTTGVTKDDHAFNSAKFTAKGVNWVAGEYAKYLLGKNQ